MFLSRGLWEFNAFVPWPRDRHGAHSPDFHVRDAHMHKRLAALHRSRRKTETVPLPGETPPEGEPLEAPPPVAPSPLGALPPLGEAPPFRRQSRWLR